MSIFDEFYSLLDAEEHHNPLDIVGHSRENLMSYLSSMVKLRLAEEQIAEGKKQGVIGGPVHLGIGQEGVAVGVSASLCANDFVFSGHRSHMHLLALGCPLEPFFSELLGRSTGLCGGAGGSMHLRHKPSGFWGSVPIVAGTISIALGAGLSAKQNKNKQLAVAYLGDGAAEEGVFHECLNIASVMNIPIIFVVENNLFASHMDIELRQPEPFVSRFAYANNMDFRLVDGNDVVSVCNAFEELANGARETSKPGLLEAITYRWKGHVDWRDDIDVGVRRNEESLSQWKERDPIKRLTLALVDNDMLDAQEYEQLCEKHLLSITNDWTTALSHPFPEVDSYFGDDAK